MTDEMVDDEIVRHTELAPPAATQFSLFELFFATTLSAVSIAIYAYVSPVVALVAGGGLIVYAIIRWFQASNMVYGGLVGFCSAMILSWLIIALIHPQLPISMCIALMCPPMGYLLGVALYAVGDHE